MAGSGAAGNPAVSATCPAIGTGGTPDFWRSSPLPTLKVSVPVPGRHAVTAGLMPSACGSARAAAPAAARHLASAPPLAGALPAPGPAPANGAGKPPEARAETARARTSSVARAAAIRVSVRWAASAGNDGATGNPGSW